MYPKSERQYEMARGLEKPVLSVSVFPKAKTTVGASESSKVFSETCEQIVYIALGELFEHPHWTRPYQFSAYIDQYLKIVAHFPKVCFLWSVSPDAVRVKVEQWIKRENDGSLKTDWDPSWRVLTKALQSARDEMIVDGKTIEIWDGSGPIRIFSSGFKAVYTSFTNYFHARYAHAHYTL